MYKVLLTREEFLHIYSLLNYENVFYLHYNYCVPNLLRVDLIKKFSNIKKRYGVK